MLIRLTIRTDNDSFGLIPGVEAARILREAATKVDWCDAAQLAVASPIPLRDSNGNTVGALTVMEGA